ncbi:MAG TPA: hypothetical protein VID73_06155 [Ktedonobacterales bacterium]
MRQPSAFPFVYRLSESWWLLVSFGGYVVALVTLIYALVARLAAASTAPAADGAAR